uniref:N-acetylneuraminate lyase n=1 Tax=Lotharella oceanica TaxID=641309 RepID=A0A7S2TQ18_9EUKA
MKASEWTQAARVVMPNLAGLKFTSLDVVDYAMLCQNDPNNHLAFLPGYESAYSAFAALNSSTGRRFGGVGGCSNFMNSLMARFIKIAESDEMTSKTKFKQLEAITTLVRRVDAIAKKTSFTAVLKVAMQRLGIATSIAVRLPARELSAEEAKWVKGELDALYVDVERLLGGEA